MSYISFLNTSEELRKRLEQLPVRNLYVFWNDQNSSHLFNELENELSVIECYFGERLQNPHPRKKVCL